LQIARRPLIVEREDGPAPMETFLIRPSEIGQPDETEATPFSPSESGPFLVHAGSFDDGYLDSFRRRFV